MKKFENKSILTKFVLSLIFFVKTVLLFDLLTPFGTGGDTFIPLSFLDQILSADLKKKIQTYLEVKIDINQVDLTLFQVH